MIDSGIPNVSLICEQCGRNTNILISNLCSYCFRMSNTPTPAPITLRQLYAGLAMQALIINPATVNVHCPISARALELADALIAAEQEKSS